MKVLFDHAQPFLLAHGGFQTQIEETKRALEGLGVAVEYVRWWDAEQRGDLIHFFGRPAGAYVDAAHKKGTPVAMAELLTGLGSRSPLTVTAQTLLIRTIQKALPYSFWAKMAWDAYAKADAVIALTNLEAELMARVFRSPRERLHVISNGVAEEFLTQPQPGSPRGKYLVCTATITERKRVLETAVAAVQARTPLWIIGEPYAKNAPYAQKFLTFASQHTDIVRYDGGIQNRIILARAYREARGFVLLSAQESLSLSALEAAACACPLLLSDLPWAHATFGDRVSYCPITSNERTAQCLRRFYDQAPQLSSPPKPPGWGKVGEMLKNVYERLLAKGD